MRILSKPLREKLDAGVTHFCHCWRITRRDGTQIGLTDHDARLTFDRGDFLPDAGISVSAIDMHVGLNAPQPEITGALSSPHLQAGDLRRGLYDDAAFELWLVDWQSPDNRLLLLAGHFGAMRHSEGRFHVALRHASDGLRQNRGRLYQKTCDAVLGDTRCHAAIDKPPFTQSAEILSANGASLVLAETGDRPDGWFMHGVLRNQAGKKFIIREDKKIAKRRHIALWQDVTDLIGAGDGVTLIAGCDRRLATCRDKFSNAINFQGFPDLADDGALIHIGSGGQ